MELLDNKTNIDKIIKKKIGILANNYQNKVEFALKKNYGQQQHFIRRSFGDSNVNKYKNCWINKITYALFV